MRWLLFILLLAGVPLQAFQVRSVPAAVEHSCCASGSGGEEAPCCPAGQSCECGCPVTVFLHPVRIEEPAAVLRPAAADRARLPSFSVTAVTRRDRPPSPPPR